MVADSVMTHAREAAERTLLALLSSWLGEDPENRPVLRLSQIDPWQERPGVWSEETPVWVRILGAVATAAHDKNNPSGHASHTQSARPRRSASWATATGSALPCSDGPAPMTTEPQWRGQR